MRNDYQVRISSDGNGLKVCNCFTNRDLAEKNYDSLRRRLGSGEHIELLQVIYQEGR